MIFAKIYSDGDDIVFESVKKPIENWVYLAGEYKNGRGETVHSRFTVIAQTDRVAISAEAKEALIEMLTYTNPNFTARMFEGDLELCYNYRAREGERGILSFAPGKGTNTLRINRYGEVCVCYQNDFNIMALDDMKIFGNEFLKSLDISEPFNDEAYANPKGE